MGRGTRYLESSATEKKIPIVTEWNGTITLLPIMIEVKVVSK